VVSRSSTTSHKDRLLHRALLLAALAAAFVFVLPAGASVAAGPVLLGNSSVAGSSDNDASGSAEAFRFTATSAGSAQSISVYVDSDSNASGLVAGVYGDNGGHPGTLLASGSTSSPTAGEWNVVTLNSTANVLSGTTYWLAVLGTGGQLNFRDSSPGTSSCSENSSADGLTSLPSSWSSGQSWTTCSLSAYVTGVASSGGASGGGASGDGGDAGSGGAGAGGLPAGVTLKPIDGGPDYYCSHGFTNGCSDGWDSPTFFPVGPWYGAVYDQSDVSRWKDLGLNTAFRTTGSTNLPLMKANGLSAIVADDAGGPETPGMGSETVGLLSADEPSSILDGVTGPLATVPNSQQDGRFWYLNNTWNFIFYGGLGAISDSAQVLNTLVKTPDGTQRHVDVQSVDMYWFSGAKADTSIDYEGGLIYGLGYDMTNAEAECGCRYGDMVDQLRTFQTVHPAPIAQFVENGGPYSEDTSAGDYVTPPELNWSAWSSIIHGARQLIYFNHTFSGPAQSDDNLAQPYYQTVQPGQSTSIYDQTKATDGLIKQLAPEINSPQALGYVSVSPAAQTFSGIETRATDDNGKFTIFADTRDPETASNIQATFTTADGYTGPVTVVGENRTVQSTNGVFTDTFAHGSTVHVYQIP
jgi:hypothetical protein